MKEKLEIAVLLVKNTGQCPPTDNSNITWVCDPAHCPFHYSRYIPPKCHSKLAYTRALEYCIENLPEEELLERRAIGTIALTVLLTEEMTELLRVLERCDWVRGVSKKFLFE